MIVRTDTPAQSGFTQPSDDNRKPYFRKYTTPISVLKYADTVYNVRNTGINAYWYQDGLNNKSTVYAGKVPFIKFYHGKGYPEVFTKQNFTTNWGVQYQGYFRAPYTGNYNFYAGGEGIVKYLRVNSTHLMSGRQLFLNNADYITSTTIALTAGTWYSFDMRYMSLVGNNKESGLVLLWKNANVPEKVVVSAGLMNDASHSPSVSSAYTLNLSTVTHYGNVEYVEQSDGAARLTFEVPFINSVNSYNAKGYYYDKTIDGFVNQYDNRTLKKYRMVQYSEGYKTSSVDESMIKFTGQIRDFDINYSKSGDTLKVTCYDYSIFTKDVINLVSPTPIDYWQAGYLTKIYSKVNGETKPRAFDGWEVHRAYEVLLTESYLDPWSFYNKKVFNNYYSVATSGSYYIEPILSSIQSYLPVKTNYGKTTITEQDSELPDDSYAYKVDTGELYKDAIDNIMKTWYYKWGVNRYGYPYLARVNVPISYLDDRSLTYSGTWASTVHVEAFKGTYKEGTYQCSAFGNITGNKIAALIGTGPRFGSANGTTNSLRFFVRKGTTAMATVNYNAYDSTAHFYYSGPNSSNINKSYVVLARNLPYDNYKVVVQGLSGNYKTAIDGILSYDNDYDLPIENYYTSDLTTAGSVLTLNVTQDINNQRTDCVVLGSRTGTRVTTDELSNYSPANPNNPIYTYIQSSTRDLNSVYKSSSLNYVGHPRTTLIYDPAIVAQDQADFVSYNVVSEYNNPKREVSFTIQGNPSVQENDCISISEDYKAGVSTADYLWITGVNNSFTKSKYISKIDTTPTKPVNSFWEKPSIDLSNFNNQPIANFRLYNRGALATCRVAVSSAYTTRMWISTNTAYLPPKGYVKHKHEIIKYDSVSTPNQSPYALITLTRSINSTAGATSIPYGSYINLAYDPYTQESMGYAPMVKFDCLISGEIEVSVHNYDDPSLPAIVGGIQNTRVDVLTGIGQDNLYNSFDNIIWGKDKQYIWGAFDRIGIYNNAVSEYKIGKGYYVGEKYYWSTASMPYGKFYIQVRVKPTDKTQTVNDFISHRDGDLNHQFIYTRRGEVGKFDIYFHTAGLYFATTKTTPSGTVGYQAYFKDVGDGFTNILNASTYPHVVRDKNYNVFALKRSNSYNGLSFRIATALPSKDSDLVRNYYLNNQYNILQLGWAQLGGDPNFMTIAETQSGLVSELLDNNERIGGRNFYFNLQALIDKDENFSFVPKKFVSGFVNYHKDSDGKVPSAKSGYPLYMANVIYFSENVRDRSGRLCNQVRQYQRTRPINTVIYDFGSSSYPIDRDALWDWFANRNLLPFRITGLSSAHGFYEFVPTKEDDQWKYIEHHTFNGVDIADEDEIQLKRDLQHEVKYGRTNYITWFDEDIVRNIAMFPANYYYYNDLYQTRRMFEYRNDIIVPNVWAKFTLADFTDDFK